MAFGGFMIPAGGETINMATSGEGFMLTGENTRIPEVDER